jgi:hypothetical protein
MCGTIVPNWMWEYTIYCVNYLHIMARLLAIAGKDSRFTFKDVCKSIFHQEKHYFFL